MTKIIEFDEKCKACKGTGVYVGLAERDGFAVVCSKCKGTGKVHFKYEYEDFVCQEKNKKVRTVVKFNPGICIGGTQYNFGGIPYTHWLAGKPFPEKSEMRLFTCPAWWYQLENYKLKPTWKECLSIGLFSSCDHFKNKELCWLRFDTDNGERRKL